MAGKLKNAPRFRKPKAEPTSRASRIQVVEDREITSAEHECAIQNLIAEHPHHARQSAAYAPHDPRGAHVWEKALYSNRFPSALEVTLIGGMNLRASSLGVHVQSDDRRELIPWKELHEFCRNEFSEEEDADDAKEAGLSTTTPDGIAAIDPDAAPRTKVERIKDTADALGAASNALRHGAKSKAEKQLEDIGLLSKTPEPLPRIQAGSKMVECPPEGVLANVLPDVLEPNPFQPRLTFDEAELVELAASIEDHGQLTPIDVRPKPGCHGAYQIADGERRWRATKHIGRRQVTVRIVPRTDEEMAVIGMETAVRRVELNPIEKARQFARFIQEFGWTQEQLARKYDTSQGQVSNLLRLLKLPEPMQARIISREIPASHARLLVPYAGAHDSFWQRLEKLAGLGNAPIESLSDFTHSIRMAIGFSDFQVDKEHRSQVGWVPLPKIKLSDEQAATLCLVEMRHAQRQGKKTVETVTRYATNQAAWKKLLAQHEKEYFAQHPEKNPKKPGNQKTVSASAEKDKKKPPKEPGITDKMRSDWLTSWQQWLICGAAQRLESGSKTFRDLKMLAIHHDGLHEQTLSLACHQVKGLRRPKLTYRAEDLLVVLESASAVQLEAVERAMVLACYDFDLKSGPGRLTICEFDALQAAAKLLEIDLPAAWRRELAGPLTEGYLLMHSREQLAALMREYDLLAPPPSTAKKVFVDALLKAPEFKRQLPKALAELIQPAKKAKKGGKR